MAAQVCPSCHTPLPAEAQYCATCGAQTPTVISGAARAPTAPPPPPPPPVSSPPPPSRPSSAAPATVQQRLTRALGDKYEVRRLLGQGGFAEVYEVWDHDLQRRLAVKVLKPDIAWSAGMLERFKHEARTVARLNHPNILPIHFVGEGEGLVYYAMPFVEGQSLAGLLRTSGALDVDRALGIIRPILDALSHAHQNGLVHRDIKPDNVMLEANTGRPLLVDFGIAKQVGGTGPQMTATGFVVGTPQYMSPEQALGQGDIDARSDLYALGAMLFQMVTGTPPYDGATSQEIVGKHLADPVPIPSEVNGKIPRWLSDVIMRCLAKRPAERYQSAVMVQQALAEGRKSGPQETISAQRVAQRIQDAATQPLQSAQRKSGQPVAPGPSTKAARPPTALWLLLGVAVVLVGFLGFRLAFARPTLVVENHLLEPVRVALAGQTLEVEPGGKLVRRIPRDQQVVAQWFLVRPVSGGQPMGSDVQGTLVLDQPRGRLVRVIDGGSAGTPFFAPLITNASTQPLAVRVNAGVAGAMDCGCTVPAGATRAHIGYYPLFLNSSVQATRGDGKSATFQDLGPQVDRSAGVVGLRFEEKDFR